MYLDFIQAPAPTPLHVEHHTLLEHTIKPTFKAAVYRASHSVTSAKRRWYCTLPRTPSCLRNYNRVCLIKKIAPDLLISWNQFIPFPPATQLGCPLLYYEHGMSWYDHSAEHLQRFFPHVSAAIGVSHTARRMLALKHQVAFPIHICPNPLRADFTAHATARFLPTDRPLRLGTAARLVPLKAIALLILAVQQLHQRGLAVEAYIAGEGSERTVLEALIQRLDLTRSIRLLGQLDDMTPFYRHIDLFIHPSVHETMPLVVLEAGAHGIPVICPSIEGFSEIVIDQVTGLCLTPKWNPLDYAHSTGASIAFTKTVYDSIADKLIPTQLLVPEEIATAVETIIATPQRYTAMSQACLQHVRSHFNYQDYLDNFYGLLRASAQK